MNVRVLVNVNVPENVSIFIPGTVTFTFTSTFTWGFASLPYGPRFMEDYGPYAPRLSDEQWARRHTHYSGDRTRDSK